MVEDPTYYETQIGIINQKVENLLEQAILLKDRIFNLN